MPDILTNSEIPREVPAEIKPDGSKDKLKPPTPDDKSDEFEVPSALPSTPETGPDLPETKTVETAPRFVVDDIADMRQRVDEAGMGKGQDPLGDEVAVRRVFEARKNQNSNE